MWRGKTPVQKIRCQDIILFYLFWRMILCCWPRDIWGVKKWLYFVLLFPRRGKVTGECKKCTPLFWCCRGVMNYPSLASIYVPFSRFYQVIWPNLGYIDYAWKGATCTLQPSHQNCFDCCKMKISCWVFVSGLEDCQVQRSALMGGKSATIVSLYSRI